VKNNLLIKVDIPGFQFCSGKVRDWTDLPFFNQRLIVSTDRISAFNHVLSGGIPNKGVVLNQLSAFFKAFLKERFDLMGLTLQTDLVSSDDRDCFAYLGSRLSSEQTEKLKGRMSLVKKAEPIPVEAVVRGFSCGSLWEKYSAICGKYGFDMVPVWGHELPLNLREADQLPKPIFTPTTKAPQGENDTPLRFDEMEQHVNQWLSSRPEIKKRTNARVLTEEIRSRSLTIYGIAYEYAKRRGILIADTKMEFGINIDEGEAELHLIDEVLTPDSSRFWDAAEYKAGGPQPSYDKQPVRDWLVASGWDKKPPVPSLPSEVIEGTQRRYITAYERLIGKFQPPA